jgi:hypothetical protein
VSKQLQQMDLLPKSLPSPPDVSVSTIVRRPTLLRAIHLAAEVSGLEDKEIYGPLDIDASHWTRIKSGAAHFPADERFLNYMDVVNNEIPLIWIAEKRGYDWASIRKHRSHLERENEKLRNEIADRDRALSLILQHGRR